MADAVHLVKPTRGVTFCGIESHQIYTKKGVELAGMERLTEVNCAQCLGNAVDHYEIEKDRMDELAQQVYERYEKEVIKRDVVG